MFSDIKWSFNGRCYTIEGLNYQPVSHFWYIIESEPMAVSSINYPHFAIITEWKDSYDNYLLDFTTFNDNYIYEHNFKHLYFQNSPVTKY